MFKMIAGIVVAFIAITFLTSFMEPMVESIGLGRGSNALNCPGYVDSDETDTNTTYDPDLESYSSACNTITLLPFILVAAVMLGILFGILYGDPTGTSVPAFR